MSSGGQRTGKLSALGPPKRPQRLRFTRSPLRCDDNPCQKHWRASTSQLTSERQLPVPTLAVPKYVFSPSSLFPPTPLRESLTMPTPWPRSFPVLLFRQLFPGPILYGDTPTPPSPAPESCPITHHKCIKAGAPWWCSG